MNNDKKLIIAMVCVILCIGFASGGILLYLDKNEKWAPDDIYVYNSNGYMAIEMDEEIKIAMLLCSVHRNGKNPMEQYEKIYFETETGEKYEATLEEDMKDSLYNKETIYSEAVFLFKLGGVFLSGETYNFDKLVLIKKDGGYTIHKFGNIRIEMLKDAQIDDIASVNMNSGISKSLEGIECDIENRMQTDLMVKNIYLGEYVEYSIDSFSIPSSNKKEMEIELTAIDKSSEAPCYSVVKPKITLAAQDGQEYVCSTIGSRYYLVNDSIETVRNYLLNYPNRIK